MSAPRDADRRDELARLEREHDELVASLPAHSVPAAMLMRIEALEDEIETLRTQSTDSTPPPDESRAG